MSTVAEPAAPAIEAAWKPKFNPWTIAGVVTLATFMEVLDSSIANVALPHIAGNLSISEDEATWVLSSYLVANAVVLPISAWLSTKFGRKRFYMTCVWLFGLSSLACGLAPNLPTLVLFRIIQGLGGGGLAPTEQAILADTFPPEKRGQAFSVYGMAVVVAPIVGPTLGGYITDNFSWRWLFLINVPVAIASLYLSGRVLEDPPYLARLRKAMYTVDYIGLSLLAIGIGALQVTFDKGEREDWFASPFIVTCAAVAVICIVTALIWEYYHPHPVLDVRLFKVRNFSVACIMMFMLGASLYGATVLIPQFLQTLMGYTAMQAGMVLSPGGIIMIISMPLVGKMVTRVDPRKMIFFGFLSTSLALFYMLNLNLEVDFRVPVMMRIYQCVGLGFLWIPISTMCYEGVPPDKNNNVSGMTNLARNLGGSLGIAGISVILSQRSQFHQNVLSAHLSQSDPEMQQWVGGLTQKFMAMGNDSVHATQMAYQAIYGTLQRQAVLLGSLDAIFVFACICLAMTPFAFLMKKASRGARPRGGH
ncbi:MAG: DHA2 family efflux MFS transporter permease subunit [Bryobacteraceae bacterium]